MPVSGSPAVITSYIQKFYALVKILTNQLLRQFMDNICWWFHLHERCWDDTVCPRSLVQFYIVSRNIKLDKIRVKICWLYKIYKYYLNIFLCVCLRGGDPFFAKKNPDPGLCASNEGRFLKLYWINILDNFKATFFVFILLVSDFL